MSMLGLKLNITKKESRITCCFQQNILCPDNIIMIAVFVLSVCLIYLYLHFVYKEGNVLFSDALSTIYLRLY